MPTSSQLMKIWKRLSASTRLSIEKQNSDRNRKKRPIAAAALEMPVFGVDLVVLDHWLQLIGHVAHREQVDERGDERHHEKHEDAQLVDMVAEFEDAAAGEGQVEPGPAAIPGIVRAAARE